MSWLSPVRHRLEAQAHRYGIDRLVYRFSRYTPAGLHRWYGHHRFDREFDVETRGYSDWRYEPTPADQFRKMIEGVPLTVEGFTFVDFGSGKGKALLMAAEFPFRRIVGVELWPDLHRTAQQNIRRYRGQLRCPAIESVCCDAADYAIPEERALLYFFNPFNEDVLTRVLGNIGHSLARHCEDVFVLFYSPVRRGTPWDRRRHLDEAMFLKRVDDQPAFAIYSRA